MGGWEPMDPATASIYMTAEGLEMRKLIRFEGRSY